MQASDLGKKVKYKRLMCQIFQAVAADQGGGDPGDNVDQGQHLRHHRLLRRQQDRHEPGIWGLQAINLRRSSL